MWNHMTRSNNKAVWRTPVTKAHFYNILFLKYSSPGSVTDTEYRGISKYRYRRKNTEKTINRYFNFVNTTPSDQSSRPFWRPTQPD